MDGHLLDNTEFIDVLTFCLNKLPDNWSSAIHLKYLEEKDGHKICQELGISSSNYWQILHRAKLQSRVCLEKNWIK
jgi:DNA-directed RNA polymerase specialized sigma24 family protein